MFFFVRRFTPEYQTFGTENLPEEGALIISNHAQMNGPICVDLFRARPRSCWCASEMLFLREVPDYAYEDFWSGKPWWIRWFFRLASYAIAPFSVIYFGHKDLIPVYRDARITRTFKMTIDFLKRGMDVVIFPEGRQPYNNIVNDFQTGIVFTAQKYFRETKKILSFVPMYIAPELRSIFIGKPIAFNPNEGLKKEQTRICSELMEAITKIAADAPFHTVVPYSNIPKKKYMKNVPIVDMRTSDTKDLTK